MIKDDALSALSALSQSTRLDVFRLLVKTGPDGLPAGEIAEILGIVQNTMSAHLTCLHHAGLVVKSRQGRVIRYEANFKCMGNLLTYLMQDCCGGDSSICTPVIAAMSYTPKNC